MKDAEKKRERRQKKKLAVGKRASEAVPLFIGAKRFYKVKNPRWTLFPWEELAPKMRCVSRGKRRAGGRRKSKD